MAKVEVGSLFDSKPVFSPVSHASVLDPEWWVYDGFDSTSPPTFQHSTILFVPLDSSLGEEDSFLLWALGSLTLDSYPCYP